jgi:hypothetical protein
MMAARRVIAGESGLNTTLLSAARPGREWLWFSGCDGAGVGHDGEGAGAFQTKFLARALLPERAAPHTCKSSTVGTRAVPRAARVR